MKSSGDNPPLLEFYPVAAEILRSFARFPLLLAQNGADATGFISSIIYWQK
jgi:hypothetical protein